MAATDGEKPARVIDVAKIGCHFENSEGAIAKAARALDAANPNLGPINKSIASFRSVQPLQEHIRLAATIRDILPASKVASLSKAANVAADMRGLNRMAEAAKAATSSVKALGNIHANISTLGGPDSSLARAAEGIARQQRSLDALMEDRHVPVPNVDGIVAMKHSGMEINTRLARIESQFERITEIAADSAQVGVELQTYASNFLQEFKNAASENSRASRKVIGMAVVAIVVPLAIAIFGHLMPNREAIALRQSVEALTMEVAAMRASHERVTKSIIVAPSVVEQWTAGPQ